MYRIGLFHLIILTLCNGRIFSQSQTVKDEIAFFARTENHEYSNVDTLLNRSSSYLHSASGSSRLYAEAALELAIELKYLNGQAKALSNIGRSYREEKDFNKAIEYFQKSISFRRENNLSKNGLAIIYNHLGNTYKDQSLYSRAIVNLRFAVKIWEEIGHKNRANGYNNLAIVFKKLGEWQQKIDSTIIRFPEHDSAFHYYLKFLHLAKESVNWSEYADACNNVSELYRSVQVYDTALIYVNKAEELFDSLHKEFILDDSLKYLDDLSIAYTNKGNIFKETKDYKLATFFHKRALVISQKLENQRGVLIAHNNLGVNLVAQNQYDPALVHYNEALGIMERLHFQDELSVLLYGNLAEIYDSLNRSYLVSDFTKRSMVLKDKLRLQEMKTHFQDARDKILLEQYLYEETLENERNQLRLLSVFIFSAGMIIIFVLLLRSYRQKQKVQQLQLEQKEQVHAQTITFLMKDTERRILTEKNILQDQLLEKIGRELHDNVGSTMTACKRSLESLSHLMDNLSQEVKDRYHQIIQSIGGTISDVRNMSHDLANLSLQNGLLPALREMCYKLNQLEDSPQIKMHTFQLENIALPSRIELNVFRIIQESLANILKHAEAKNVTFQLILAKGVLNVTIEDDGKGFDPNRNKLGLGLLSIEARSKEVGGTLIIDSAIGKGSSLFIEIPLVPRV